MASHDHLPIAFRATEAGPIHRAAPNLKSLCILCYGSTSMEKDRVEHMLAQWNPQQNQSLCCLLTAPSVLRKAKSPRGQRPALRHPQVALADRTRSAAGNSGYRRGTRSDEWIMGRRGGALCADRYRPTSGEGRKSRNARQHERRFPDRWWSGPRRPNPGRGTPRQPGPTGGSLELTRPGPNGRARDIGPCRGELTPLGVQWS